jgi:hypothetical protein
LMVPKLRKLVVAHRTPYIHGIHTNQYYTRFYEKVNFFLRKNPLFLNPSGAFRMCRMSRPSTCSMHTFRRTIRNYKLRITNYKFPVRTGRHL